MTKSSWPDAVKKTVERIRHNAKITNEPEVITNKKINAVMSHDPSNGDIVVVDVGSDGKKILMGIKIK